MLTIAVCVVSPPLSALADDIKKEYRVTFGARGESSTVESVTVENLTNGKWTTLEGQDTLLLTNQASDGVTSITSPGGDLKIADGKLVIRSEQPTRADISVYATDGRLVWQTRQDVGSQPTEVALPPLSRGVYVMSAVAPDFRKSIKWMQTDVAASFSNATIATPVIDASDSPASDVSRALALRESPDKHKRVELQYEEGDVLRFTGTSGKMRTITMNSPRSSHPVYFDFFKCEDADGYNYTIVRVGDMLWMAEDLHARNVEGAEKLSSADEWTAETSENAIFQIADNDVYYTKSAAMKALPDGWNLPTQGEIDYLAKRLGGYEKAGLALKSRGNEWGEQVTAIDSCSVGLTPNGYIWNGDLHNSDAAYYLLKSTQNYLCHTAMQISEGNDQLDVAVFKDEKNAALHVRGVRNAPSVYSEMLADFGYTTAHQKLKADDADERPPMDFGYTIFTGPQSIAFDYTGGQFNSAYAEARSGLIYKEAGNTDFFYHEKRNDDFLSDCGEYGKAKLRKMASMLNGEGSQYVVEMQWERPFRVWTQLTADGKYKRTDTPDVFGSGGVYITVVGDSVDNYAIKNRPADADHKGFYLPLNATIRPLSKSQLPYALYDDTHRATETRIDYVQRVFQLLTADFTGDGVDELVIHIDGEIWVYDGAKLLDDIESGRTDTPELISAPLYHKSILYETDGYGAQVNDDYFSRFYLKRPLTRIAVGDVTTDGVPDIAALRVGVMGQESYDDPCEGEVFIYQSGDVTKEPYARSYSPAWGWFSNSVFCDIKVGNVVEGKESRGLGNDIIVLQRNYSGNSLANEAYLWIYNYKLNGSKLDYNNCFELYNRQTHERIGSFRGYGGHIGNNNITIAYFNGKDKAADVIVGADLWRSTQYYDKGGNSCYKLEYKFQALPFVDNQIWSIFADNIIAADPSGSGRDHLFYFRNWSTWTGTTRYAFQGFSETWFNKDKGYVHKDNLCHNHSLNTTLLKHSDNGASFSGDMKDSELMWWFGDNDAEWGNSAALCPVYDRKSLKVMKYRRHDMAFSEPRIHALLAAPPSFDYSQEPDMEPNAEKSTSWGFSSEKKQETTSSSSISSSVMVGFEFEINAPLTGTKIGGTEISATFQSECSKSMTEGQSMTYSTKYDTKGEDRVILQVTPFDLYTYEVTASGNPDEIGGEVNLSIPRKPITLGLSLEDYDSYMCDAPGTPNLHNVLRHTVGNPFTYPSSPDQLCANAGGQVLWGNGKWDDFITTGSGGSTEREITLETSTAQSAGFSFSVENELVVTAGCVKAGVGFGYGNSNETTHEETSGFTVSGMVPGLKSGDRNPARPFFDWNLCWYKCKLAGQTFPVVNYVVKR